MVAWPVLPWVAIHEAIGTGELVKADTLQNETRSDYLGRVCSGLWLAEPLPILRRVEESLDHLRAPEVAAELFELRAPELEA